MGTKLALNNDTVLRWKEYKDTRKVIFYISFSIKCDDCLLLSSTQIFTNEHSSIISLL